MLLEGHQWAVPLRDAVMRAGGVRISDDIVGTLDLIEGRIAKRRRGRRPARRCSTTTAWTDDPTIPPIDHTMRFTHHDALSGRATQARGHR